MIKSNVFIGVDYRPKPQRSTTPDIKPQFFSRAFTKRHYNLESPPKKHRRQWTEGWKLSEPIEADRIQGSFSRELKIALNNVRPTNKILRVTDLRGQMLSRSVPRSLGSEESEIHKFIYALIVHDPSDFRKSTVKQTDDSVDIRSADKILHDAKKIIKDGLKRKQGDDQMKGEIEYFWEYHISSSDKVRWDIFEENLLLYLDSYMVCDIGHIRRINWKRLMSKIYKDTADYDDDFSLWVPSHSYKSPTIYPEKIICKKDFFALINKKKLHKMFRAVMEDVPCYVNSLKKNGDYVFADGSLYKGKWQHGKREGICSFLFPSGDCFQGQLSRGLKEDYGVLSGSNYEYRGDWKKDMFNGYGTMKFPDGSCFQGLWRKGTMQSGKFYFDGHVYQGEFKDFTFDGPGSLALPSGEVQKGYWKQGLLFGVSTISKPDGSVFKGIYVDGYLEGKGKMITPEYTYRGFFVNSKPSKQGRIDWNNGNTYYGEFFDGKFHGVGTLTTADLKYEGEFHKGEQTGKSKITFKNGVVYTGKSENSVLNGHCTIDYPETHDYLRYEGHVVNMVFHGKGKLIYRNKSSYEGEWKNGLFDGEGLFKNPPEEYKGTFSQGLFDGYGEWSYGLAYFKGIWDRGLADGKGIALDWNGDSYRGMFVQGQPAVRVKLQTEFIDALQKRIIAEENIA